MDPWTAWPRNLTPDLLLFIFFLLFIFGVCCFTLVCFLRAACKEMSFHEIMINEQNSHVMFFSGSQLVIHHWVRSLFPLSHFNTLVFLSWKYFEEKGTRCVLLGSSSSSPLSNHCISRSYRKDANSLRGTTCWHCNTLSTPTPSMGLKGQVWFSESLMNFPCLIRRRPWQDILFWFEFSQRAGCTLHTHTHKRKSVLHNRPQHTLKGMWKDFDISQFRLTAI